MNVNHPESGNGHLIPQHPIFLPSLTTISLLAHLMPKVTCNRVQMPETKKMVLMRWLCVRPSCCRHSPWDRIKGMAMMPPNAVRQCWESKRKEKGGSYVLRRNILPERLKHCTKHKLISMCLQDTDQDCMGALLIQLTIATVTEASFTSGLRT